MNRLINAISAIPTIAPLAKKIGNHVDLKPNGIKIYVDMQMQEHLAHQQWPIFSKEHGRIIKKTHQKSESFVQTFGQVLAFCLGGTGGTVNCLDTANATRTLGAMASNDLDARGLTNTSSIGIRVGTGTNAPAATDYELQTIIANGTSSGQLQYQAGAVNAATTSSNTVTFTMTRQFINNSGGTVTITEVGAVWQKKDNGAALRNFLMLHDKLGVSYAVTNTNSVTVTYTISTTT